MSATYLEPGHDVNIAHFSAVFVELDRKNVRD